MAKYCWRGPKPEAKFHKGDTLLLIGQAGFKHNLPLGSVVTVVRVEWKDQSPYEDRFLGWRYHCTFEYARHPSYTRVISEVDLEPVAHYTTTHSEARIKTCRQNLAKDSYGLSTKSLLSMYLNPKQKETDMTLKIEDRVYINDNNAADMTDDELFSRIHSAERDIAKFNAIEHKPEKLKQKLTDLETAITKLVLYIDTRG